MPSAATVQPALLARGLRRVLLERGVEIHEGTAVRAHRARARGCACGQPAAASLADQVVLAANAWAAGWPGFRTRVLAWGSYIVLTEPIPDRLAALGWTGGEAIADSRFTISYFRTTRDGRIAFGAGVGAAGFDGRIGPVFTHEPSRRSSASSPTSATSSRCSPTCGSTTPGADRSTSPRTDSPRSAHSTAVGCSTRTASRETAWGRRGSRAGSWPRASRRSGDPVGELPLFGRRQRFLPPEPFRYLGARAIREALIRQDDALDAGRRPGLADPPGGSACRACSAIGSGTS